MKNQIEHTADFKIHQPCDELFHLFTAEGEKKWVPNYEYEKVSASADIHEDYVFMTNNPDYDSGRTVWLVKEYKPERNYIVLYKVEPDKVGVITLQCAAEEEACSRISVTYKYIALDENGQKFVDDFTADKYKAFMENWRDLLEAYFQWEKKHPELGG